MVQPQPQNPETKVVPSRSTVAADDPDSRDDVPPVPVEHRGSDGFTPQYDAFMRIIRR